MLSSEPLTKITPPCIEGSKVRRPVLTPELDATIMYEHG